MSVLKVLHIEQNTLRNTVLKITNLDLTSGNKTLKLNNLYVYNGTLSNPLIIHYTGSSVTLPIQEIVSPPVFYKVDWGDGIIEDFTVNNPSHAYASSQLYIIKIYIATQGILVRFGQNLPMWDNISRIPSLGNERFCSQMFRLTYLSFPSQITSDLETLWDTSQVTDMSLMFENSVFNGAIGGWDTGNVIDMSAMFRYTPVFNKPLNNWNTGNVTAMIQMFRGATSFDQPLDNNWNTINVYYMSGMFQNATSFNQPLNTWNTSNVITMNQMFQDATSFDGDVNPWNTIKVTDMASMFQNTPFNKPLNNWNTSNVTTMNQMFRSATSFDQPLNTFLTGKVTNMSRMFQDAHVFNHPLNNWNTSNVTTMSYMFNNAYAFSQNIGDWDTSNVTDMSLMFYGTGGGNPPNFFTNDNYKSLRNWNISSVTTMSQMFKYEIQLTPGIQVVNFSFGIFTTMLYEWAVNSTLQTNVPLGVINFQGATDIQFQNTTLKTYYQGLNWTFEEAGSQPVQTFDVFTYGTIILTPQVQFIWEGVAGTVTIPIVSGIYTINWGDGSALGSTTSHTYVEDGTYVIVIDSSDATFSLNTGTFFSGLYSIPCCGRIVDCTDMFTNIITSQPQVLETIKWWDTQFITNMDAMFASTNMNLDLSLWNLSGVTSIKAMFKNAQGTLTGLNNWNTSSVTDMTGVFYDCTTIDSPLDNWNTSLVTSMGDMFLNVTTMSPSSLGSLASWDISSVTTMVAMFTQLIDIQVFTDILTGWLNNGTGPQTGVIMGIANGQQAYLANNLETSYVALGWTFSPALTWV